LGSDFGYVFVIDFALALTSCTAPVDRISYLECTAIHSRALGSNH
jgi:hypothetical protein